MRYKLSFSIFLSLLAFTFLIACGGKDKKTGETTTSNETKPPPPVENSDGDVPLIDTANLNDEASILAALQKVVDARIADQQKRKADPAYHSQLMKLMALHTAILVHSNTFYKSITDGEKALEYGKKFDAIESRLHQEK
ncbi:MAG: hypothetical protein ABIR30_11750 [Chitinophagaceae bacterium]